MTEFNPCVFKQVCRSCSKADLDDRPQMCISLKCPEFDLCEGCGKNKTLHKAGEKSLCKGCLQNHPRLLQEVIKEREKLLKQNKLEIKSPVPRIVSITAPGIPPKELEQEEIDYYNVRWDEFKGYYRNPSAYFICHMLILEEINLSYLNRKMLEARGELEADVQRQRGASIGMLKTLNDQLPNKEAEEVTDDEKSLAMIYDSYLDEIKQRKVKGVTRVLSPEAIALAPELIFPLDPKDLLLRCGFKIGDIEEVIEQIVDHRTTKTPEEILEFFGFKLKEKYALNYEVDEKIRNLDEEFTL